MKQDTNNLKHYIAEEGYTFKRKIDGYIMGNELYLGLSNLDKKTVDVIENYEEIIDMNYNPNNNKKMLKNRK